MASASTNEAFKKTVRINDKKNLKKKQIKGLTGNHA